ncbi:hypothetical protein EST38_g2443 [Candolleomyces aberdarensis]|uniref:Nephrocystin 3-like N-terminal domain-containing protein n=1 Tax=Candolleomyces aberdarensis TaxID=2316362 RepID=A0A4Q2DT20_9AGAR|nr:hypothetical protein EST38_g2443 [Candolleomyces aberdarensis]
MSEATETHGDNTAGNSERNTPIPPATATPAGSQTSGRSRLKQAGSDLNKTAKKPFSTLKRFVRPKKGDGSGEGGDIGSGVAAATSGVDVGGAHTTPAGERRSEEIGTTGRCVMLPESQGTGANLNEAPSALEETELNDPLGQDPVASRGAQGITRDSFAAPPLTLGQLEDPVLIKTGEATESLTTTTIVTATHGTPSLTGEEVGSDSIQGPKVSSPTPTGQAGEGAGISSPLSTSSKKTWAIVAGALKKTLSGAVPFIPDPFKGPAQVLLQIFDVFEKAKSNKEEMEDLKTHCNLLNESMAHAFKRRQDGGSDYLDESIGRLVGGIHDTLVELMANKSTGVAAYVLVEDNAESLKKANQTIDQLLQCFWLENSIAGALVLGDVYWIVKDQEATVDQHFKKAALDKLKHVPSAVYNSQDLAKVNSCFEGTRMKLLAGIGHWMSDTTGKPIYVLDGIAGIGKSTVAKTVAQRAAAINSLGVSFFFSRDHADRQQASGFVHTIAYQLACCDPSYGKAIATAIDDHPESLHKIMAQ